MKKELANVGEFDSHTGKGVSGRIGGRSVAIGNSRLMDELNIDFGPLSVRADEMRAEAQTVMFVALDGKAAGLISVADPIKDTSPQAVRDLHAQGLRVVMLTGDNEATAKAVARKLGIDDVIAGVLPERKTEIIKQYQSEAANFRRRVRVPPVSSAPVQPCATVRVCGAFRCSVSS